MTKYTKGADLERKIKKELEEAGYYVIRSAGSKGRFDLAAFHPTEKRPLLIQVKVGDVSARETEGLRKFATAHPYTEVVLWDKNYGKRIVGT